MRILMMPALALLMGCGQHLHVASPQFQRAPEITCIIIVESDKISMAIAQEAIATCKDAIAQKKKGGL